jgi:hypothetical protein
VLQAGAVNEGIELTLHPYEATVVVLTDEPIKKPSADPRDERRLPLTGDWQVAYDNEPAQPVDLPHIWENEPGRQHYSGAATYTTTIDLGSIELAAVEGRAMIDFGDCEVYGGGSTADDMVGPSYRVAVRGPVGEVAQVRLTGSPAAFPGLRRTGSRSPALCAAAPTRSRSSSTTPLRTPSPPTSTLRG